MNLQNHAKSDFLSRAGFGVVAAVGAALEVKKMAKVDFRGIVLYGKLFFCYVYMHSGNIEGLRWPEMPLRQVVIRWFFLFFAFLVCVKIGFFLKKHL